MKYRSIGDPIVEVSLFDWKILGALSTRTKHQQKKTNDVIPILIMVSFVIGSTQAILRAHFATRVTIDKSGEGLGFYAVAQKSASIIAPLLIILVSTITNSIKPAFLVLFLLVIIGFMLAPQLNKS